MKNLHEITTNDFRQKFKSLGHSENRTELTSGGEISPEFLDILSKFIDEWTQIGGSSCKVMFTSGNDNFHKNLGYNSRHSVGQAVDLTLPNSCHTKFIELLNTYKTKYNGFSYIDEYRNPSSKATGPHFHISYSKGSPEGGSSTTPTTSDSSSSSDSSAGITWSNVLNPLIGGQLKKFGFREEVQRFNRLSNILSESISYSDLLKPVEYSEILSSSRQTINLKVNDNSKVISPEKGEIIEKTNNKVVIKITQKYDDYNITIYNLTNIKVNEGDTVKKGELIGKTSGKQIRIEVDKGEIKGWFKSKDSEEVNKRTDTTGIQNLYKKDDSSTIKNLYKKDDTSTIKNLYKKDDPSGIQNLYSKNINEEIEKIKRLLK